jgi:tetratricopeptide (TPR) repeat protein
LNSLGAAYDAAGKYPDAIKAFQKILTLDATNGLALQNIAAMHLRNVRNGPDRAQRLKDAERSRAGHRRGPRAREGTQHSWRDAFHRRRADDAIEEWSRRSRSTAPSSRGCNLWEKLASANRRDEAVKSANSSFARLRPTSARGHRALRAYIGR